MIDRLLICDLKSSRSVLYTHMKQTAEITMQQPASARNYDSLGYTTRASSHLSSYNVQSTQEWRTEEQAHELPSWRPKDRETNWLPTCRSVNCLNHWTGVLYRCDLPCWVEFVILPRRPWDLVPHIQYLRIRGFTRIIAYQETTSTCLPSIDHISSKHASTQPWKDVRLAAGLLLPYYSAISPAHRHG